MQSMIPQESANRLVSILSESIDSKAFVLYKTGYTGRNALCFTLGKFLNTAGQATFTVTSDCPMETFLSYYSNVVISDFLPKLKVNSGWKIIKLGGSVKSGDEAKNIEKALKGVYGYNYYSEFTASRNPICGTSFHKPFIQR